MPLPKPDKALLCKVLSERQKCPPGEDIFRPTQDAALAAIGDGAITRTRAESLLWFLESAPPVTTATFPNNLLLQALRKALEPSIWGSETEHDLLVFIFAMYSETLDVDGAIRSLINDPLPLFPDPYQAIFDSSDEPVSISGKICDFTGAFACGPRRKCFEIVAMAGGAASDGGPCTDYLFVAEKHMAAQVISGAIRDAIGRRLRTGAPKIYAEKHFPISGP